MAVSREMAVGQVAAALRPSHLDVVEVREVLLAMAALGFDPVALYRAAVQQAGQEGKAPALAKVLPPEMLEGRAEGADSQRDPAPKPESIPEEPPPPAPP